MKVLVTGGTGFLGRHLVRRLLEAGHAVRVLARKPSLVQAKLGVENAAGDVLDRSAVERAVAGTEAVFHFAGRVERGGDATELYRLHVEGIRNVMDAAAKAGARRVVLGSTSGVVGMSDKKDFVAADDAPYAEEHARKFPYYLSKIYAEKMARDIAARTGVELVIARPSLVLGPGDRRLSSTREVHDFLRGRIPGFPPGGVAFVDVRDAAGAVVAMLDRAPAGASYILNASNCTFETFFRRLEAVSGVSAPRIPLTGPAPLWAARALGWAAEIAGKKAPLDPAAVEMGYLYWYCDSARARRELGFAPRDADVTLRDTVRWLRKHFAAVRTAPSDPIREAIGRFFAD
jgi:dihydroflavonol-4-reductase